MGPKVGKHIERNYPKKIYEPIKITIGSTFGISEAISCHTI